MGLRSLNHFQNNLKRLFASKRLVFSKAIGENATNRFNVEIFRRLSPGFIFWNYSVSQIVDKVSRNSDNLPYQKPFCPENLIKCPIMLIKCPEILIKNPTAFRRLIGSFDMLSFKNRFDPLGPPSLSKGDSVMVNMDELSIESTVSNKVYGFE